MPRIESGATIYVEIVGSGPVGPAGTPGAGVAPGGSTGQVLKKKSNRDYDTQWVNADSVQVDAALDDSSANPVQNRVVKAALDGKQEDFSALITAGNNNKVLAVQNGALAAVSVETLLPDGDEVSY